MRILLIMLNYHPVANPNVYRWSAIAEYWVGKGHELHILCTRHSRMPDEDELQGVRVHRSGSATLLDWAYNLIGAKQRRGEVGGLSVRQHSKGRKGLEKLMDLTWRRIFWPDGSCLWFLPGKALGRKLLREYQFDAMVSVGLPFTAHWIAHALKKQQAGLLWLMDIEDPFCFSDEFFVNNAALYSRLNYWAERQAFLQADRISLTVKQARERYLQLFPWAGIKTRIIPPLFNLSFPEVVPMQPDKVLQLGYFGTFYPSVRTPDFLLQLLEHMVVLDSSLPERLIIHLYGELSGHFAAAFEAHPRLLPIFRFHGLVSRKAVAVAMPRMNCLINIGNITDYHLPSKSVDYLMTGKPVVNLSFVKGDPFTQLFQGYPYFLELNASESVLSELASSFLQFMAENKERQTSPEIIQRLGRPFQLEPIACAYLEELISAR